ncbi:HD domain-containing protein [Microbulbifer mangrovi]|uniref:HD domain-containing protein n=1 Tax=Microbulbifer mangrovi TaxID=927787 RepID=UPI00099060C8|nr:HD domain-containing protein [Microbulbifer mangrovi]
MEDIEKILQFIVEVEKLKAVTRKTRPVGLERYENSGEHSWHVALCALMLKDYANEAIDINRVVKMLLIHDLGEIGSGDRIVYQALSDAEKMEEKDSLKDTLNILPQHLASEFIQLWEEFEEGKTPDAKFAKSIDRLPPLLHNIYDDGHSWKKNNISREQVFEVNSKKISSGSKELWSIVEKRLSKAVEAGVL